MFGSAARKVVEPDSPRALFDAIGRFLDKHRLGYDPACYDFAYRVLATPDGPLARTVAALTEGRVRLTEHDIAALTGRDAVSPADDTFDRTAALIALTRSQMADFTGLVDQMRAETTGFGRDLAASVDALDPTLVPRIIDVTAVMLSRVRTAETRLENATSEAAELRAQLDEARVDARADALTGLANRRALTEAFAAHVAAGGQACLAVCDVDHFKQINDRFGHAVGDRVLTAIAATLAESCPDALVARYGGEEFAILFADQDLERAVAAVDAARASVAVKRYRLRDAETILGQITFSGGIVATTRRETFDAAFARADALLYDAKRTGRNRIFQ